MPIGPLHNGRDNAEAVQLAFQEIDDHLAEWLENSPNEGIYCIQFTLPCPPNEFGPLSPAQQKFIERAYRKAGWSDARIRNHMDARDGSATGWWTRWTYQIWLYQ